MFSLLIWFIIFVVTILIWSLIMSLHFEKYKNIGVFIERMNKHFNGKEKYEMKPKLRKLTSTECTFMALCLTAIAVSFLIVTGIPYELSPTFAIFLYGFAASVGGIGLYIAVRFYLSHGMYEFVPLLRIRLWACNNRWQRAIFNIRVYGVCDMCKIRTLHTPYGISDSQSSWELMGVEEAIEYAKKECFGDLYRYAESYKPKVDVHY